MKVHFVSTVFVSVVWFLFGAILLAGGASASGGNASGDRGSSQVSAQFNWKFSPGAEDYGGEADATRASAWNSFHSARLQVAPSGRCRVIINSRVGKKVYTESDLGISAPCVIASVFYAGTTGAVVFERMNLSTFDEFNLVVFGDRAKEGGCYTSAQQILIHRDGHVSVWEPIKLDIAGATDVACPREAIEASSEEKRRLITSPRPRAVKGRAKR